MEICRCIPLEQDNDRHEIPVLVDTFDRISERLDREGLDVSELELDTIGHALSSMWDEHRPLNAELYRQCLSDSSLDEKLKQLLVQDAFVKRGIG